MCHQVWCGIASSSVVKAGQAMIDDAKNRPCCILWAYYQVRLGPNAVKISPIGGMNLCEEPSPGRPPSRRKERFHPVAETSASI